MKKRNGFVSNSSSCSFLIYGIAMDKEDMKQNLKEEFAKEFENIDSAWELGDCVASLIEKSSFEAFNPSEWDDTIYLGVSWDMVHDEQTGKEFKDSVESELNKIFKEPVNCSTFSQAWENR